MQAVLISFLTSAFLSLSFGVCCWAVPNTTTNAHACCQTNPAEAPTRHKRCAAEELTLVASIVPSSMLTVANPASSDELNPVHPSPATTQSAQNALLLQPADSQQLVNNDTAPGSLHQKLYLKYHRLRIGLAG